MKKMLIIFSSLLISVLVFIKAQNILNEHINTLSTDKSNLSLYKVVNTKSELNDAIKKDHGHLIIEDAEIKAENPQKLSGIFGQFTSYELKEKHDETTLISQLNGDGKTINLVPETNTVTKTISVNKTEYVTIDGIKTKSSLLNMNSFKAHYYFDSQNTTLSKIDINKNYSDVTKFKINGKCLKYDDKRIYLDYIPDNFMANLLVQIKNHKIVSLIEKDQIETIPYSVKEEVENLHQKISFWRKYKYLFLLMVFMMSLLTLILSYYGLMILYK